VARGASLEAGRSPVYFESTVALAGQDGGSHKVDLPDAATGIFLTEGLDRFSQPGGDLPVGLLCRRAAFQFIVAREAD
jgi:hypothetical protein